HSGSPAARLRHGAAVLQRSGVRRSRARRDRSRRAFARGRRVPRLPVRGRAVVRAFQPLPGSRAGRADVGAGSGARLLRIAPVTGSGGLTRVATDDLEQLLAALESGALAAPLSKVGLGQSGYGPLWEALEPFARLDGAALRLLIQTVIAERRAHPQRRLDLVWSGPDAGPSHARYTRVVVPELFARAARHVTLAGYSFDHGERLFEPLHRSMIDRKVAVRVFIDVGQVHARLAQQLQRERRGARLAPVEAARAAGSAAYASAVCSLFHELYWPFGN